MSDPEVSEIAAILCNDLRLVLEAEFFYFHTKPKNKIDLSEILQNPDPFSLFSAIVGQYAVEKRNKATVKNLGDILEEMGHTDTKEAIMQRFRGSFLIRPTSQDFSYKIINNPDLIRRFEDRDLQELTAPSTVSILQLLPGQQSNQGRLAVVVTQLLKILTEIGDNPVAIISINGKQRSGKSFLATQFIKYLNFGQGGLDWLDKDMNESFQWRQDFERVTSGIQVWHKPFYVNYNGKEIGVIVMDTQGLHDPRTATHENSLIFGLSALLSSVFIYNEKHYGDDSLQYLRSFLEFAKFASGEGPQSSQGRQLVFQKLIVLLRDWSAETQFKFGYYDDDLCPSRQDENLKKKFFDLSDGIHPQSRETREGIIRSFQQIAVYAMSSPAFNLPEIPEYKMSSSWQPNFRENIKDFTKQIFSPENISASVKTVFGDEVTGSSLIPYVEMWAVQIKKSEGAVPSQTIFESTVAIFFKGKVGASVAEYKMKMTSYLDNNAYGVNDDAFELNHIRLMEEVIGNFLQEIALGGEEAKGHYARLLREELQDEKDIFAIINLANIEKEEERKQKEQEKIKAEQREAEYLAEKQRLTNEMAQREAFLQQEIDNASSEQERQRIEFQRQIELEQHQTKLREVEFEKLRMEQVHEVEKMKIEMENKMAQANYQAQIREAELRAEIARKERKKDNSWGFVGDILGGVAQVVTAIVGAKAGGSKSLKK